MLKLVLTLIADWNAFRRAMTATQPRRTPRRRFASRFLTGFCDVSIWPVEPEPAASTFRG